MQNGLIPDSAISASSQSSSDRGARNGRLGNSKSWTAVNKNNKQWLQVDFGRVVEITQIATQGREGAKEWVKEYHLQYSNEGSQFVTYGNPKVHLLKRTYVFTDYMFCHLPLGLLQHSSRVRLTLQAVTVLSFTVRTYL